MECIVALLLAEDALAVHGGILVMVRLVLAIELRESDGEGEQHQQEEAQELAKVLQHLTHGDLRGGSGGGEGGRRRSREFINPALLGLIIELTRIKTQN